MSRVLGAVVACAIGLLTVPPSIGAQTAVADDVPIGRTSLTTTLIEDLDASRSKTAADGVPAQSPVYLVPWAKPDAVIGLLTVEGKFTFANVPEGDYTIRIYWPAGFASPEASPELPLILRAAVHVDEEGGLTAPPAYPETWPGPTMERFDPARDRTILGALPDSIVVNRKDADVLASVPDAAADTIAFAEGSIDVGAALGGTAVGLPSTGAGSKDNSSAWWVLTGFSAMLVLPVIWFAKRRWLDQG